MSKSKRSKKKTERREVTQDDLKLVIDAVKKVYPEPIAAAVVPALDEMYAVYAESKNAPAQPQIVGISKTKHRKTEIYASRLRDLGRGRIKAADGFPIRFEEVLYGGDGQDWKIIDAVEGQSAYILGERYEDDKRIRKPLRPKWLVHNPADIETTD